MISAFLVWVVSGHASLCCWVAVTEAGNLLGSRSLPPEMGRISLAIRITPVANAGMWVAGVFGGIGGVADFGVCECGDYKL